MVMVVETDTDISDAEVWITVLDPPTSTPMLPVIVLAT